MRYSFCREDNGDVTVTLIDDAGTAARQKIDVGCWISEVLNMTAFGERPGDWHAWLAHHMGTHDALEGQRGGY